ncbi:MAG: hypothetical protein ACXWT3_14370 [Methylococcaceae bacterium]
MRWIIDDHMLRNMAIATKELTLPMKFVGRKVVAHPAWLSL